MSVSEFVPQIHTRPVVRSTFSAYGVSVPSGSVGSFQVRNSRVVGLKRAISPALKLGTQRSPFASKRRRRGAGNGVSMSSYAPDSGSIRPIRWTFSWLNQTPPSGAMSMP